jgi:hypothetical protein
LPIIRVIDAGSDAIGCALLARHRRGRCRRLRLEPGVAHLGGIASAIGLVVRSAVRGTLDGVARWLLAPWLLGRRCIRIALRRYRDIAGHFFRRHPSPDQRWIGHQWVKMVRQCLMSGWIIQISR